MSSEEALKNSLALVVAGSEIDGFSEEMWDIVTKKKQLVFARFVSKKFTLSYPAIVFVSPSLFLFYRSFSPPLLLSSVLLIQTDLRTLTERHLNKSYK